jgi:rod shape-determining protein MreD
MTLELMILHPFRAFSLALPFLLTAILVVVANLPVSFTGGLLPAPILALAAVYFWTLARPDLMTPIAVLLLGLLEDLLSGGPPGLWATGFLAAYVFIDRQRDILAGLSNIGAIVGFAGAMLTAGAAAYVLTFAVYQRVPPLAPLLLECVMTVVFYPLVALPSVWLHRRVVGPSRGGD